MADTATRVATRIDASRQVAAVTAVIAIVARGRGAATRVAPPAYQTLLLSARAVRQAAYCRCKKRTVRRAKERRKNLPLGETAVRA